MEVTCPKCEAVYSCTEFKSGIRDKDTYECHNCGTTILKWNGGVTYYGFEMIKEPKK